MLFNTQNVNTHSSGRQVRPQELKPKSWQQGCWRDPGVIMNKWVRQVGSGPGKLESHAMSKCPSVQMQWLMLSSSPSFTWELRLLMSDLQRSQKYTFVSHLTNFYNTGRPKLWLCLWPMAEAFPYGKAFIFPGAGSLLCSWLFLGANKRNSNTKNASIFRIFCKTTAADTVHSAEWFLSYRDPPASISRTECSVFTHY